MQRLVYSLLVAVVLLPLAAAQWTNQKKGKARDTTIRNVTGVVQIGDADDPAGGAIVKLRNLKTQQVRSFITQADAKYIFQSLSTSIDYELTCEYKQMACAKRNLTTFDTRLDAILNLKVQSAKDKEGDRKK